MPSPEPEPKITVLPEASREEQLERWKIEPHFRPVMDDERPPMEAEDLDFLTLGGWHIADETHGGVEGLTSHRGVISPDELETLDWDVVQALVEAELGFTVEDAEWIYASHAGPPSRVRAEKRAEMDERLLAIQEAGGNMTVLATVLGWGVDTDGKCQKMQRALRRAREARDV